MQTADLILITLSFINETNNHNSLKICDLRNEILSTPTEHDFPFLVHTILHTHILQTLSCTIE